LWKKGSSGPVTQWLQLVSYDWSWHSHGSLIPGKFGLKINRSMKTPWQECSGVACSNSTQNFSRYNNHKILKVLIAITPQWSVCSVSKAWRGCTSDKYLTKHCRILKIFTFEENLLLCWAKFAISTFRRGKIQLVPFSFERSRGIANIRSHVERVDGLLRQKTVNCPLHCMLLICCAQIRRGASATLWWTEQSFLFSHNTLPICGTISLNQILLYSMPVYLDDLKMKNFIKVYVTPFFR